MKGRGIQTAENNSYVTDVPRESMSKMEEIFFKINEQNKRLSNNITELFRLLDKIECEKTADKELEKELPPYSENDDKITKAARIYSDLLRSNDSISYLITRLEDTIG